MPKSRVDRFDEAMGNFSKAFNEIEQIKDELENWKMESKEQTLKILTNLVIYVMLLQD